jgi:hypothetical protein
MTNKRQTPSGPLLAVTLAAGLLVSAAAAHAAGAAGEVKPRPAERRVDVFVGGEPFTAYIWPERLAKPVPFPICTAGANTQPV